MTIDPHISISKRLGRIHLLGAGWELDEQYYQPKPGSKASDRQKADWPYYHDLWKRGSDRRLFVASTDDGEIRITEEAWRICKTAADVLHGVADVFVVHPRHELMIPLDRESLDARFRTLWRYQGRDSTHYIVLEPIALLRGRRSPRVPSLDGKRREL